jgi:hypothetical protein
MSVLQTADHRDLVRSLFTLGRTVPYGFVVARAGPARRGVVIR